LEALLTAQARCGFQSPAAVPPSTAAVMSVK